MQRLVLFVLLGLAPLAAAEPARPFSATLAPEQRARLGLGALTPAQLAELDAAIAAYARGETVAAVQQAERVSEEKIRQAGQKAAEAAVAEYRQKQEPGVLGRALDAFKRKQEEERRERFVARVVGEFRGWSGGTYFPLENGQVWRQTGSESHELPPVQAAEVEIFKSPNGYWRLKYGGAWITVKRLQ